MLSVSDFKHMRYVTVKILERVAIAVISAFMLINFSCKRGRIIFGSHRNFGTFMKLWIFQF